MSDYKLLEQLARDQEAAALSAELAEADRVLGAGWPKELGPQPQPGTLIVGVWHKELVNILDDLTAKLPALAHTWDALSELFAATMQLPPEEAGVLLRTQVRRFEIEFDEKDIPKLLEDIAKLYAVAGQKKVAEQFLPRPVAAVSAATEASIAVAEGDQSDDSDRYVSDGNPSLGQLSVEQPSHVAPEAIGTFDQHEDATHEDPAKSHKHGVFTQSAEIITNETIVNGKYEIECLVGQGTFGNVYKARDISLNREVAIKFLLRPTVSAVKEAEQLAKLHDALHIVSVHEVGEHNGMALIVMQFCSQGTLAERVGSNHISQDLAVDYCRTIAAGLNSAHSQGILHRDLKPANVLFTEDMVLKVGDFGEAHEKGDRESAAMVRGTYPYMACEVLANKRLPHDSDESCRNRKVDASVQSDIYSLGVILYELLCGKVPFEGDDVGQLLVTTQRGVKWPPKCAISKDLRRIVERCLEPSPSDRYQSAANIINELDNWKDGKRIERSPLFSLERNWRWLRASAQNKWIAVITVLLIVILVIVVPAFAIRQYLLATQNNELLLSAEIRERETQDRNRDLRDLSARHLFQLAVKERDSGRSSEAVTFLGAAIRRIPSDSPLNALVRNVVAIWSDDVGQPMVHNREVRCAALSADGQVVVTGGDDATAQIWSVSDARVMPIGEPFHHPDEVSAVALSPDGTQLLTGTLGGEAYLWDLQTRDLVGPPLQHKAPVFSVVVSQDGATLLTGGDDKRAQLWDTKTLSPIGEALNHDGAIWDAAFSGGKFIATCGEDSTAKIWSSETQELLATVEHAGPVSTVRFSSDGELLLTSSYDGTARLSRVPSGEKAGHDMIHDHRVTSAVISADDKTILTSTVNGGPHRWSQDTRERLDPGVRWVGWGKILAASRDERKLLIIDNFKANWIEVPTTLPNVDIRISSGKVAVASAAKSRVIAVSSEQSTRILGVDGKAAESKTIHHAATVLSVAVSSDGKRILTGDAAGQLRVWDTETTRELREPLPHDGPVQAVAFCGERQVVSASGSSVYVWDVELGKEVASIQHEGLVIATAVSPSGRLLATAGSDRVVKIWSTDSWQESHTLLNNAPVGAMAFSPDGLFLATCSDNQFTQFWDTVDFSLSGKPITTPSESRCVSFSPDSQLIAVGCADGTTYIHSLTPRALISKRQYDGKAIHSLAWNTNSNSLVSGDEDGVARLWKLPKPLSDTVEIVVTRVKAHTALTIDDSDELRHLNRDEWTSCLDDL